MRHSTASCGRPIGTLVDSTACGQIGRHGQGHRRRCSTTCGKIPTSSPHSAPSHGRSEPLINTWFLGPTRVHISNSISIGSAVSAESTHALQLAAPFPSKLTLRVGDVDPHLMYGSFGPRQSTPETACRFCSATIVIDRRQRDHATPSVTINRIYVRSTAMRPRTVSQMC